MRIAFDHQAFSRQKYGGVSRIYINLASIFHQSSFNDVRIFSNVYINKFLAQLPSTLIDGKYITKYPPLSKPLIRYFLTRYSKPAISKWKADIVHETYFSSTKTGPEGVPTVLTVYDMIHELFPEQFFFWDRTRHNKRDAIGRANHVICISESTKNDLTRLYQISPEKISVIHLAANSMEVITSSDDESYPQNNNRPFILYVGQRSGYKNSKRFVTAFFNTADLFKQFDLICFGGGKFTRKERFMHKKLGADKYIFQVSGDDELLSLLYRSATAFVCPSLYEGFGITLLESMTCKCPVICSNTSSIPEVAGDAAEYFDPLDENAIVRSLRNVLLSPERQKELIQKGSQRLSSFSWEKCAKQTLEVYEKVVHKR